MHANPKYKGLISDQEAAYIDMLLTHGSPEIKESGLERLCKLYRQGYRLKAPHAVQQALNGMLHNLSPKVRRWALNSIALVGIAKDNLQATLDAIARDRLDEDILSAGVAAMVALTQPEDLVAELKKIDVPLEGAPLLAAAQQTDAFNQLIAAQRVKLDSTDYSELRLATLLIGLEKSPEHLFSLDHKNASLIGCLNTHQDKLVAQYSVWAISESSALSVANLGTPLKDIEARPENVRGWIYQLVAADSEEAQKSRDIVLLGTTDKAIKARHGLANGLRLTYFDGIEEITAEWFGVEINEDVRASILEHMARHAEHSPVYMDCVRSAYISGNSILKARIEAACRGNTLYGDLKRLSLRGELNLFEQGGLTVVNNTFNANSINAGVISGNNTNVSGDVKATQHIQHAQEQLEKLIGLLQASGENGLEEGKKLAEAAKTSPKKTTISKVLGWMKKIKEAGGYILAASKEYKEIYDQLDGVVEHIL